ncbi:Dynamin family protein [Candidatus Magnetomoraceae bacterium gMMP-13]
MKNYNSLKTETIQINEEISSLFLMAEAMPGASNQSFSAWKKVSAEIKKQMSEDIVRVAAIGSIKSGKSTFVNSLFKGDYLKRGAGVVTSIVTRIRTGSLPVASLYFKTWDEVNSDMRQSMVLFPSISWDTVDGLFDIRREKDRQILKEALESLDSDKLISNDTRNINSVLLDSYLKGYEHVKDIISSNGSTRHYKGKKLEKHKDFVGNQYLAVYLKDIELQLAIQNGLENIEIADCQGSDSPNPMHLAMIQDYLLKTHFLIYVISSRTGLRQADIRFLSMIKQMGIMDNIIFVLNCDLSEHDSLEDLKRLVTGVFEEISMIRPDPEVYVFSSIFNLFKDISHLISHKDKLRLKQWEEQRELCLFSNQETKLFQKSLHDKLKTQRFSLLLKNNLERLSIMASGMNDRARIRQDILLKDRNDAEEIIKKINDKQKGMQQIKLMIKDTLSGALVKIKLELGRDVDSLFDDRSGQLIKDIFNFIRNYSVSFYQYENLLNESGYSTALYTIFQEFKTALDTFMSEVINPRLIKFILDEENKITNFISQITVPYEAMIQDSINDYASSLKELGISLREEVDKNMQVIDMNSIKGTLGLEMPTLLAIMRYSARVKTEAIIRVGFYGIIKFIKKILKKSSTDNKKDEFAMLKKSIRSMKKETENSILVHFIDYRENIKYQYIFKLVEAISRHLHDRMTARFDMLSEDFSEMTELAGQSRKKREQALNKLKEIENKSEDFIKRIDNIRKSSI